MAHSFALGKMMWRANASRAALFRNDAAAYAAFLGNFRGVAEPVETLSVSCSGTPRAAKFRTLDPIPQHAGDTAMVITAAHVPAIVALIAGILILVMPRLLNFIVAIYLIFVGLVGMGLLKWLHM
jgi:hypothetical protein